MKKSSESEFIKAEGNRNWWQLSIWTLLLAAAAIVLISWMRRRRPSEGGRKQSQQQMGDDDDDHHQKSPSMSIDSDEDWLCGTSFSRVVSSRLHCDDGRDKVRNKLERFKIKPRGFMNVSTKKN
ncbi:hypothetical protein LINPERHAP1_LOCUS33509 [Linum perenne]